MVILKSSFLIFVTCMLNAVKADEIKAPEFIGEIIKYKESYGGELILGERTSKELKFWFRTMGGNYHQCHMTGVATSGNGETYKHTLVEQRNKKNVFCNLSIIVLENSVVLIDNSNQCKVISCGQRAGINGAVFHREK